MSHVCQLTHTLSYLEAHSRDWNVTKIVYKPKEPTPSTSTANVRQRSAHQPGDHHRKSNNHLPPPRHQPQLQEPPTSQSPKRNREGFIHPHTSLLDSSNLKQQQDASAMISKALSRADEMERRAKDAEETLNLTLVKLTEATDKVTALKIMVEEAQQKAAILEQKVQSQRKDAKASSSSVEESAVHEIQRALHAEECAIAAKTQAEERANLAEAALTRANERILHLQEELSAIEQRATEAEQRSEEVTNMLTQMERRVVQAEARSAQAEQSAQLSQHQAFNSEMRAREAERQVAEAEQQVRDANARTETAERRAAFADRGEEGLWTLQRNEINLTDTELGRGGWAAVKIAKFRGIRVAAKCIYGNILSDYNRALFVREMNMAARLRHPNLVQFIGATIDGEPLILLELMPTTLRIELRNGPPNHDQILTISRDVAKALNYMHLMLPDSLIHRDVSSANVLLEPAPNNSWKVKLSDYGSVNFVQRTLSAGPGNPLYAAPEANNPHLHSTKMDVYSYGVLLSEMCSGLFPDPDRRVLVERINDEQMADLVGHCLAIERDRRPTMTDILATLNTM